LGPTGKASFSTAGLGAGNETVTAAYNGDTNFTASSEGTEVAVSTSTTVTGNVKNLVVGAGTSVLVSGATVNGSIVVQAGGAIDIENSTLHGSPTADGATALRMCNTTVSGGAMITKSTGFVLIGDSGDDACAPNSFAGSVTVTRNKGGLEVIGNHINGALTATANTGAGAFPEDVAPEISGNK
jgi:hypothetical protein